MQSITTSVILSTDITEYLDHQSHAIRCHSGRSMNRSQLL